MWNRRFCAAWEWLLTLFALAAVRVEDKQNSRNYALIFILYMQKGSLAERQINRRSVGSTALR